LIILVALMAQKYLSWNVVEFPALAHIYIDYDDTPTGKPRAPLTPIVC
jgi:hypothetical protein